MNLCEASLMFALKVEMKKRPLRMILFTMIITLLISAYGMKVFETSFILHGINATELDHWGNALWCSFITMTTVGYGDYYPISHERRLFACIICLLGYFYVTPKFIRNYFM